MNTFALVRQEPSKETLHAMDEAYMPFGELLAVHDALLAAQEPPTDAELDELCRAYSATSQIYGGVEPWWEPDTKHMHRDELRRQDRARMRSFLSALTGQRP